MIHDLRDTVDVGVCQLRLLPKKVLQKQTRILAFPLVFHNARAPWGSARVTRTRCYMYSLQSVNCVFKYRCVQDAHVLHKSFLFVLFLDFTA